MFVPGKRSLKADIPCQPCQDRDDTARAAGLCIQCQQHMCKNCFDTHKQFKVSKGHTLGDTNESLVASQRDDDLETCDQHKDGLIKFYCPKHDQVGCGDCMILAHKTCKVEYICDKGPTIKENTAFKSLIKETEKYQTRAKDISSSIKNNKLDSRNINDTFVKDVQKFSEDKISKINGLKDTIINKAETVKCEEVEQLDILDAANEESLKEATQITELLQSQIDQPNKLFTNYIRQKPKFKRLQEEQERIKMKNTVRKYTFQPDDLLNRSVKECRTLGSIQDMVDRDKEPDVEEESRTKQTTQQSDQFVKPHAQQRDRFAEPSDQPFILASTDETDQFFGQFASFFGQESELFMPPRRENILQEYARQKPRMLVVNPQPLKARQLMCRNIEVDGQYLSYVDNGRGHVGIWVDNKGTDKVNTYYFELDIIRTGRYGYIAIGFVPKDYPGNSQPGWRTSSIGYHADDGSLFLENGRGRRFGPKCYAGDRMGCIMQVRSRGVVEIGFTKNGQELGEVSFRRKCHLYPAVGLHSPGEKVRVILDAQTPYI